MKPDRVLDELARRQENRKLDNLYARLHGESPGAYPWQVEFHNAGKDNQERMLMAGNRSGKTTCAAAEIACHAIGKYPEWWDGRRFDTPVRIWVGSESSEASRDITQLALLGPSGAFGTGWVPGSKIIPGSIKYRQAGVSEVVDFFKVEHVRGISTIAFKTYEQGRRKWQGASRHVVWLDEEPPFEIYTEALTRVLDVSGLVMITFTPLIGATETVRHFMEAEAEGIYLKNVTWDDAPHLDKSERDRLWNSYPEHERETRASGSPMMGTGAVFPINDSDIVCDPFPIPDYYYRINGLDFGIDHPFGCAFCAWDKDTDVFYVYDGFRSRGHTPVYHAEGIFKHGKWIPNAWPHDGLDRDKGSGIALKDQYRSKGLYMLKEHACYRDERGNHVEPGLIEMLEWMRSGRFKIFSSVSEWFEEKRLYHRKDGKVIKLHDDLISATRYAFMMRRFARVREASAPVYRGPRRSILGGRI